MLGKDPAKAGVSGSLHALSWLVVSSGPERDFNLFAPGVMYWYNAYAKWFEGTDTGTPPLDILFNKGSEFFMKGDRHA